MGIAFRVMTDEEVAAMEAAAAANPVPEPRHLPHQCGACGKFRPLVGGVRRCVDEVRVFTARAHGSWEHL